MLASFMVWTVPLDGDDSATEEALDPHFREAAIGCVALVDSSMGQTLYHAKSCSEDDTCIVFVYHDEFLLFFSFL